MKYSISLPKPISDLVEEYAAEGSLSFSAAIQEIVVQWAVECDGKKWVPPQEGRFE